LPQRCGAPARIALVARFDVDEDMRKFNIHTVCREFIGATRGAGFCRRGDEEFRIGMRRDNGSNVSPVQNGTDGLTGKVLLSREEFIANDLVCGYHRGSPRGRLGPYVGVVQHGLAETTGRKRILRVLRVAASAQSCDAYRAVEKAGIKVWQAKLCCQGTSNRSFA
jgi:hypothetical protein